MADATQNRFEMAQNVLLEGELGRRLVHASGSGLPALHLLGFVSWPRVRALFLICAIGTILLEILRLSVGLDWFIYEHLTREYEQEGIAGYMLYMLSSAAVVVIAPKQIAIPAVLMLMIADPISGSLSSDELRTIKRLPVLVAMFCLCALIALPFVYKKPFAVLLGGVGGMLADGIKMRIGDFIVDDNLTIAPAAAIGLAVGIKLSAMVL